jgi:hypothetical protein
MEETMNRLRQTLLAGAFALAGTATAAVTATPASAASTVGGCTTTLRVNTAGASEATVLCTQGSGTYRAAVIFGTFSLSSPALFVPRTGPIVQVGQPSTVVYAIGNIGGAPVQPLFAGPQIVS